MRNQPLIGPHLIVGIAWYRPEQWDYLREVAFDPEALPDTYEEWLALATQQFRDMQAMGFTVRKVEVDVGDLLKWCMERGVPVNGESRSGFASVKVQEISPET